MNDRMSIDRNVRSIVNPPRHDDVTQARLILLSLFGFWVLLSVSVVIFR